MVEITPKAEKRLDAQLARRLIRIELGDIEVPQRPTDAYPGAASTVFFRVLAPSQDRLHVELWDRGDFCGARGVSVTGSAQLRSRRIALGAAELARRLRQRRITEARRLDKEARLAAAEAAKLERELRLRGATLSAGARGAYVTDAGPLGGPVLSGGQRFDRGSRAELSLGTYAGAATVAAQSPALRWLEVGVRAGQEFRVGPRTDLVPLVEVAAAAVRVSSAASVDEVAGQSESWSARAGVQLRLEQRLGSRAFVGVGPDVGWVLRPVPIRDASGEKHELGGMWLGLGAELILGP